MTADKLRDYKHNTYKQVLASNHFNDSQVLVLSLADVQGKLSEQLIVKGTQRQKTTLASAIQNLTGCDTNRFESLWQTN